MKELSGAAKTLKTVYNKGYRVNKNGKVKGLNIEEKRLYAGTNGYLYFSINDKIGTGKVPVHRLQAYQKFGKKLFEDRMEVRHLNGNIRDNSWENIGIGTHSQNMMDQPKKQRIRKSKSANKKVMDKEALEIRERVKTGNYETYQKLAEEYGLNSKSSIHYIIHDREITIDM